MTETLPVRSPGFTGGGFPGAVAAEWTKFTSLRSTWLGLVAMIVLMLGCSGAIAAASKLDGTVSMTAPDMAVSAVFYLGQFIVLTLAALFVTGEYASGSIRTSLQCVPLRGRFLLAKAAVLAPVLFVLGTVLTALDSAVAAALVGVTGTSAGHVLADAAGAGGYFALLGVLTLGIGAALRSTAATILSVIVLLLMFPLLIGSLSSGAALDYFPGTAGVDAMTDPGHPNAIFHTIAPYPQWAGLLICAAWTATTLTTGTTVLHHRNP